MKYWTKYITLLVGLLMMVACTGNDEVKEPLPLGTPVTVKFQLETYDGASATRAWNGKTHGAAEGEGMKSWVIIVVNNTEGEDKNKVETVLVKESVEDAVTDEVAREEEAEVFVGTKRIYTFANIAPADIENALGLEEGGIAEKTLAGQTLSHETVTGAMFRPQGNHWESDAGIPMSNWQEVVIEQDDETHRLFVCRMIAKLEFEFRNQTGKPLTVTNLSISDITSNDTPIRLLPSQQVSNPMNSTLMPDLPNDHLTETVSLFSSEEEKMEMAAGATMRQTIYVNESEVSASSRYGLFLLTLTVENENGEEEQLRYALLNNEQDNWTYISRNDYRIIPIIIEDYKLDLIPVDFPPIGVYPAAVKEEDGVFTCTFHAMGDFELIPVVTKYSTVTELVYGTGEGQWNYVADSWVTPATTLTGEENNANIYRTAPSWDATQHVVAGTFNENRGEKYHEMQIQVNKGNSVATRVFTCRVWVIRE